MKWTHIYLTFFILASFVGLNADIPDERIIRGFVGVGFIFVLYILESILNEPKNKNTS